MTQDQIVQFDLAKDTLRTLIAAYSARMATADGATAEALRAAQMRYAGQLRQLSIRDTAAITKILRDYPELIRQVRAGTTRA
jgi:tellurite resistance protein